MSHLKSRDTLTREMEFRLRLVIVIIAVMLLVLLLRAWFLQGVWGEYYKHLSENNRMNIVEIAPPRGLIYDRNGTLLVNNVPTFYLYIDKMLIKDSFKTAEKIEQLVGIDRQLIIDRLKGVRKRSKVLVKDGLTLRQVAIIESRRLDLPGVLIEPGLYRNLLEKNIASHLLGYVGEITDRQMKSGSYDNLTQQAIVGQAGVEQSFNSTLIGRSGKKIVEKNAFGIEKGILSTVEAVPGYDIHLTIDLELQRLTERLMQGKDGAVVVMNVNNGRILAMVSQPNYPANVLSRPMTTKQWHSIVNDPGHPLTNKATQGIFPPGSIFKVVVAAAGLEEGIVTAKETINCNGHFQLGNTLFRDWKRVGHGKTDLHKALVESCDVYFYMLGQKLGVDRIEKYAKMFGLGVRTGIELSGEKSGLIPSKKWKRAFRGEKWFPGETVSVSIGQGFVSITPLQAVSMFSIVANGGRLYKPATILNVQKSGQEFIEHEPVLKSRLKMSPKTLKTIREALRDVVNGQHGTGKRARSAMVSIAGKTGTAQVVSMPGTKDKTDHKILKKYLDHAWFAAFAPYEKPEIAVVVLVEHGGHGGSASAPIAKEIIEAYLTDSQKVRQRRPWMGGQKPAGL